MTLSRYLKNKFFLSGLLILFALLCFEPATAQRNSKNTKKELENKKKKINAEIDQISSLLNETKAHKKTSIIVLLNINIKLEKRQDLINTINAEIMELDKEIKENESHVEQLRANLEKLKKDYARMIVYAQRNQDSYSTLMFIFAAENFNQAYSRLKYMQQYSEFRKKQAAEIVSTQNQLLAQINELKDQKHEKNVLLGNEVQEKKVLSAEKTEKEIVLSELQKKEKELKSELEKRKQAAIQLQVAIKRMIEAEIKRKAEEANRAELKRLLALQKEKEAKSKKDKKDNSKEKTETTPIANVKADTKKENVLVPVLTEEAEALSADFANNRGKLPWPVVKGVICETYGDHEHPAIKGFMMFNNGIEICTSKGSQARAVFDGEVTGIAVSPTGGKLVIIRHGEYLSVYTNLGDVTVKTGQKVTVKQVIGNILYNDDEGKTSLNLQIWKGQKTMDPGWWLFNGR
ncbi:MAG: peptidoglycan DD-metalloendopeptidase family protein [Bacteroidia bacterium]|nr:peptidoglycan DD-metalloendopeptidase family protein [Bacteroidia bacterium]